VERIRPFFFNRSPEKMIVLAKEITKSGNFAGAIKAKITLHPDPILSFF